MSCRVGLGFDAHPFAAGRPLLLGGIELPHPVGLAGHSDGDALLHAIADAVLGASGQPSLGEVFSDQDPAWSGASSRLFVERARDLARGEGWAIANVDAVVIAEAPRIVPHAAAIRASIARLLEIAETCVGVRGTSSNGLGFTGRGEGLAAMAVVLLEKGR